MPPKKDLTGQRFGRLVVIGATNERGPDGSIVWDCLCDCGNSCTASGNKLTRKGHSQKRSCGCLQKELHRVPIHNESKSILFHKWTGMKDRCYNVNAKNYDYYGGRGIAVCEEWRNSYEAFRDWANASGYKDGLSLDRIDPEKGYSPDNCRWITMSAQQGNKRSNIVIVMDGQEHTLAEWCQILNLPYKTIYARIKRGWEPAKALTTPLR